ncbi:glycosyltransferase domain-containing protein [Gryllotalpicola reticulitermitis]|uniref:Glycosyltransferase domain-containing protein n=1 Tax=Gryllotalpicola reticulitermitis TaxID=1184153 RepID=A0ABV8Q7L4_9MICO
MRGSRVVVYTAVFGGYEKPAEQPIAKNFPDVRFIFFTDDPTLKSESWDVVLVEPSIPWDAARSVRELKIVGHPSLDEFDVSIWIDNRIQLQADPQLMAETWLGKHEMAMALHSWRMTVRDEFSAVLADSLDDPGRVREQLNFLSKWSPETLTSHPLWGAIIVRRPTAPVRKAMRYWMDQVLRHSRRDQLSLMYALGRARVDVNRIAIDNHSSSWHTWISVDTLPKDKKMVYSSGYRYSILVHVYDRVASSRVARGVRRVVRSRRVKR